jgi:hypothetical protein
MYFIYRYYTDKRMNHFSLRIFSSFWHLGGRDEEWFGEAIHDEERTNVPILNISNYTCSYLNKPHIIPEAGWSTEDGGNPSRSIVKLQKRCKTIFYGAYRSVSSLFF